MLRAFLLLIPSLSFALAYDVHFLGLDDKAALKALKEGSELVNLQERPPVSVNGLRYRVQSDLPNLLKVLRAFAYYDATISTSIENTTGPIQVNLFIHTGSQYELGPYQIFHQGCHETVEEFSGCGSIRGSDLGLEVGKPAFSVDIVNAELTLLQRLSRCGHPLAYIDKRRIEVDMASKTVNPSVCIEEGPLAKFGPSTLYGLKGVHPRYLERRFAWKEGEVYDSDLVEETQRRILKSDLFSSVLVSHAEQTDQIGELPMKIRLTEAKHRTLSVSLFYATVDGPGGSAGWTHRNIRGMGEILSAYAEWSLRYWIGSVSYAKPDFLRLDQMYRAMADVSRENIYPYLAFSYRIAQRIERKIDDQRSVSWAMKFEHIRVSDSGNDGHYTLGGLPIMVKYSSTDSPLNPTRGYSLIYQGTPYQSLEHGSQHFVKQRITGCFYAPIAKSDVCVLAIRAQVGSIAGAGREDVPLTKLFLGGSLDDLRGYRYKTVSPRKHDSPHRNKPLGGRSALFGTVETRFRVTKTIGFVPFFDIGTVSTQQYPNTHSKWFKSVGLGLRYFAFFGPLRFDVALPLNRRHKYESSPDKKPQYFDPFLQFYASIGQTF